MTLHVLLSTSTLTFFTFQLSSGAHGPVTNISIYSLEKRIFKVFHSSLGKHPLVDKEHEFNHERTALCCTIDSLHDLTCTLDSAPNGWSLVLIKAPPIISTSSNQWCWRSRTISDQFYRLKICISKGFTVNPTIFPRAFFPYKIIYTRANPIVSTRTAR